MHFVTFTVHRWADVFTRKEYVDIILESFRFCQKEKGLMIYAWVIMSNHIHVIIKSRSHNLSDIIRDFKKYTATRIIKAIADNPKESRKDWLLHLFRKDDGLLFWNEGYHGEEIFSSAFYDTKVNYIHQNPVRANIVLHEEDYLMSSCADFYGLRKGPLILSED